MEKDEVRKRVYSILRSDYNMELKDNYYLSNDLGMDGLRTVEFIVSIENRFNIGISDKDMETVHSSTIGEIISFVHKRIR